MGEGSKCSYRIRQIWSRDPVCAIVVFITCLTSSLDTSKKMARTKKSTIQATRKNKQSRKLQLENARKAKLDKQKALLSISDVEATEHVPASPCVSTTQLIAVPSISTNDNVLAEKTRTQFKYESYKAVVGDTDQQSISSTSKRAIVDISRINAFVRKLCCSQCKNDTLCLRTDTKKPCGLAVCVDVYCFTCEEIVEGTEGYLSEKGDAKDYLINRQAVFSSLVCGLGSTTFNNFCEMMDLQGMHHKTFHSKANSLYTKLESLEEDVFSKAVQYVREVHAKQAGINLTSEDILDISVSFDGTWLTRGHSSHIGVGCVVDLLTGLCLDVHVMCTYCQVCESTGKPLSQVADKSQEYAAWIADHHSKCDKNFTGSSGMMEVEAARVLWLRSVGRYKLRYTTILSDGDAKTFNELNKLKPYGEDVIIDKEECINHVSKRLGTALRNVVTDCRKKGVTLGGRGHGQLTQNAIRKLTIYYNRAIRKSSSTEEMKKAVMAALYHCYSTDKHPRHELCPAGQDSWCFYQSAIAKHKEPGPHQKLIHTPLSYEKLHQHLLPIYERLTDNQLLSRCVSGKTQNANESLHSLIWSRCGKDKFASRRRVLFAVLTAAREFNFGPAAAQDTARFFGFQLGIHMKKLGASRVQKRERNSLKYTRDRQKKRRETVRAAKLKRMEELLQLEGGPAYAAGQF